MATQKIVLKTVEQQMDDFVPTYAPIYPLLGINNQKYDALVGKHTFKRLEAMGDIRAKRITPKDTEIAQLAASEGSKVYKKYFYANQFVNSSLQDQDGVSSVVRQVLDEHNKQADELLLTGDGSADNNVVNNGLFWSGDVNHITNNSVEIASGGNDPRLLSFHDKVITTATQADLVSGRKLIIFYGANIVPYYNGMYSSARSFKSALQDVLGGQYSTMALPAAITPSSSHGWLVVNRDQVKLHYSQFPVLDGQGFNEEKKYYWFNFLMGSMMVEVLQSGAIIKQAATLAA